MLAKPFPEESSSSSPFLMCSISDTSALEVIEALHQGVKATALRRRGLASSILDANGAWSQGGGAEPSVDPSSLASRPCVEYSVEAMRRVYSVEEHSVELVEARAPKSATLFGSATRLRSP